MRCRHGQRAHCSEHRVRPSAAGLASSYLGAAVHLAAAEVQALAAFPARSGSPRAPPIEGTATRLRLRTDRLFKLNRQRLSHQRRARATQCLVLRSTRPHTWTSPSWLISCPAARRLLSELRRPGTRQRGEAVAEIRWICQAARLWRRSVAPTDRNLQRPSNLRDLKQARRTLCPGSKKRSPCSLGPTANGALWQWRCALQRRFTECRLCARRRPRGEAHRRVSSSNFDSRSRWHPSSGPPFQRRRLRPANASVTPSHYLRQRGLQFRTLPQPLTTGARPMRREAACTDMTMCPTRRVHRPGHPHSPPRGHSSLGPRVLAKTCGNCCATPFSRSSSVHRTRSFAVRRQVTLSR